MAETAAIGFSKRVLPECNARSHKAPDLFDQIVGDAE